MPLYILDIKIDFYALLFIVTLIIASSINTYTYTYRVKKGYYGNNEYEAREIINEALEKRNKIMTYMCGHRFAGGSNKGCPICVGKIKCKHDLFNFEAYNAQCCKKCNQLIGFDGKEIYEILVSKFKSSNQTIIDSDLTFNQLREANQKRAKDWDKLRLENKIKSGNKNIPDEWSISDWMLALVGEVGELANLIKKRNRGEDIPDIKLAHEVADIQTYLDSVARELNIDLGECTKEKFNIVSDRINSKVKL